MKTDKDNPKNVQEPLSVNEARHEVYVNGERVRLSPREFRLLVALKKSKGTLSRSEILTRAWKLPAPIAKRFDTRTVDQHIARLRKKIGYDFIETDTTFGYKWVKN